MNGPYGARFPLRSETLLGNRDRRTALRTGLGANGFARAQAFAPPQLRPITTLGAYSPVYPVPYDFISSGVSLTPAGVSGNLRPFERRGLGLGLGNALVAPIASDSWRPDGLPCSTNSTSCHASKAAVYKYETKDIVIRGKAKVLRQSYLNESPKFEGELVKYLDKKTKEQIPDRVVEMLIDFINVESYENFDLIDEVTLNILASNVGCRSVVDYSLNRLKGVKDVESVEQLGHITATILLSLKVDSGLTAWLKKLLEKDGGTHVRSLLHNREFRSTVLVDRPEVEIEVFRLLGDLPKPKDDKFRSL